MKEVYLDNAATTRPSDKAIATIHTVLEKDYGNPSSLHRMGQAAEKYMSRSRKQLADILMADPESIYFTSCATESTATALRGAAQRLRHRGKHILTSQGEHAATRENLKYLAAQGYEIETLEQDASGRILLEDLSSKLRPDTILVTCLHVNNETGCIQPVDQMGPLIHEKQKDCLFHVDAVQSFAKYPVFPKAWQIDLMSTSAHKINGPKGIGFLYMRRQLSLPPLLVGGGQERHFRSGTENVPFIAAFGEAAQEMWEAHETLTARMQTLKEETLERLQRELEAVTVNGPDVSEGAAHILNLRIEGVRSEVLLHALEDYGVYVSSGSACSSNKPGEKSPTLYALGCSAQAMDESVRISFGRYNTEADVEALVSAMKTVVPMLRRFVRK